LSIFLRGIYLSNFDSEVFVKKMVISKILFYIFSIYKLFFKAKSSKHTDVSKSNNSVSFIHQSNIVRIGLVFTFFFRHCSVHSSETDNVFKKKKKN